jgi:hypothetical protein
MSFLPQTGRLQALAVAAQSMRRAVTYLPLSLAALLTLLDTHAAAMESAAQCTQLTNDE